MATLAARSESAKNLIGRKSRDAAGRVGSLVKERIGPRATPEKRGTDQNNCKDPVLHLRARF